MSQIILDFGSANTCNNDEEYAKRMIDELAAINRRKHWVIIKWQLWSSDNKMGDNKRLDWGLFERLCKYAYDEYGYYTTASVFDKESLLFLSELALPYKIPFIKIADIDLTPLRS